MAVAALSGIRIAGIAAAVPHRVIENDSLEIFEATQREKVIQTTGIHRRRKAAADQTTSDFCYEAALDVLRETGTDPSEIGLVIFVSQTPDYVLPATCAVLAARLGLAKDCAAFDVNLGCSGYVYGMWQASGLLATLPKAKALLLVGEVWKGQISEEDRSVAALFGDCGTATLLEKSADAPPMVFDLGTDGSGAPHLMIPAGHSRKPWSIEAAIRQSDKDGNLRAATELFMDGAQVFNFTLREVPKSVAATLEAAGWAVDQVDGFVFHQANRFMLNHLSKRAGIPADAMQYSIEDFGNTSSATIPLTLVTAMADRLAAGSVKVLTSGFGVGWSWASCACTIGPIPRPSFREI
jgi:3-oxoacyl-[acyl-carrier-protein] synthase-3